MASAYRSVSPSVWFEPGMSMSVVRRTFRSADGLGLGRPRKRTYQRTPLRAYRLSSNLVNAPEIMIELMHLEDAVRGGLAPFWVKWPFQQFQAWRLAGVADGVGKAFPVPSFGLTTGMAKVGGAPQITGATFHPLANLLADKVGCLSSLSSADDFTGLNSCTPEVDQLAGFDTPYSLRVTPPSSGANHGAEIADGEAVTAGDLIGGCGVIYAPAGTYYAVLDWYVGAVWNSQEVGATVTLTDYGFATLKVAGTVPATVTNAKLLIYRTSTSDLPFWISALNIAPGGWTGYVRPAVAHGLVEFATAPTDGSEVLVKTDGYPMSLVAMTGDEFQTTSNEVGDPVIGLDVMEELP